MLLDYIKKHAPRRVKRVQALRQLYVLACQKRIMRAIDVNIRQPVYVPVTLAMASEHPTTQQVPLEVSRNENVSLNTPSNAAPGALDGKSFNDPEGAVQVCWVLSSTCVYVVNRTIAFTMPGAVVEVCMWGT